MPASAEDAWWVDRPQPDQVTSHPDRAVARRAARQYGILDVAELRACGLSADAIATRARTGRLHRCHRGVYAVGHDEPPLAGVFLATVKACGTGALLAGFAALAHWELARWDDRDVEVLVTRHSAPRRAGIRVHRTSTLAPCDVALHRGVPVTSPARTLLDVVARFSDAALRRVVREAQARGLVSVRQLAEVLGRAGRRPGVPRLRRLVAGGPAPTRSELEDVVLDLLARGGLAPPDINRPLRLDGRRIIPDFRWPAQNLVLEADGAAWHGSELAREDDAARQAILEAHGERVVRVTWAQAVRSPEQTLARIRAAGAPSAA